MAGSFGGSVKLTGESEYRKALSQITQSLRVVSSEMKTVSSAYGTNDADTKALANQSKQLATALNQEKTALQNLKSQLTSMESEYKKTQTTHKALVSQYETEKAKLADIGKTLGTSSAEYKAQQKVVADLEGEVQKSTKAYDSQTKALNNMRIQTANAETTVNNTAKAIDKLGDETKDTSEAVQKVGDGFTVFKGILANLASSAIQKAMEGLKKLGSTIVDVGKQAVASYAEYEQLVGGVETLFKDSAGIVQDYAKEAYKTAGMSANMYMETVTSFSSRLLQGLNGDTAKAAKIADVAITDMSDNANKMGTSMEMIQNAYQGFAKQNYTMLDNLKLGYGGTASEMARLINDSGVLGNKIKVTAKTVNEVSFDKMIEAIHKVQTNMGITGTTAKEASETISGSVNSMKAAWQNLLTGIADSQVDKKKLVKNFTDTVKTTAKNVIPTVKETVKGIVNVAEDLLNTLMGPGTFKFDGEAFVRGIEDAIKKVIEVFKWFVDNRDLVISAIKGMIAAFAAVQITNFVTSIVGAVSALKTMITATEGVGAAMKALNTTMSLNPFALVAGLVAGLGVALISLASSSNEVTDAHGEMMKSFENTKRAVEDNAKAFDDLLQAQQEQINTGMTELSYYENLADELDTLVDKNGKVKKGYEGRVGFITNELKKGLGLEIELNGNVVKGYKEIRDGIDGVIEKKKAQIILNAQEAAYTEALQKEQEAVAELNKINGQMLTIQEEINQKERERTEAIEAGNITLATQIDNRIKTLNKDLQATVETYNKQDETVQKYYYNIAQYENNAALAHEGKYDEMTNVTWEYMQTLETAEDQQKALMQDNITTTQSSLDILKRMYQESGDERLKTLITQKEKELQENKDKMKQYTSTTQTGLGDVEKLWNDGLKEVLKITTGKNVEFKKAADGNIQMYVDGVKAGEPKSQKEMEQLTKKTIDVIKNKNKDANSAGQNVVAGVNSGIANQSQQSAVFRTISSFGTSLLNKLKASLKEQSPSKATREMGQFLLEGLSEGVEDEEDGVLDQMQGLGKNMLDTLNEELAGGVSENVVQGLQDALPTNISTRIGANASRMATEPQMTPQSIVGQFKEALSQMEIVMDDEEMGRFIDKTVTRQVYNY